ncbi:hypothetical protein [Bdellovibrio bacteriovorus]|uniref:Uncharacterized protein n=1 Tax=Bdellovibrio bacteriovorus TaxID=959 RepID=A0A162GRG1_BDEBC|nr:hypothetical protein [Bdellovibrio bacteriovorus]KYG68777.1 hypothetical protein AZI87_05980 [Bdellovibrio bacteriovorus]
MNALLRKKKEWEFENERYLLKLVSTSADVTVESVKRAGLITSFLAYLVYKSLGVMLAIAAAIFRGPQLVRLVSPQHAFEPVEATSHLLESQIKNPYSLR